MEPWGIRSMLIYPLPLRVVVVALLMGTPLFPLVAGEDYRIPEGCVYSEPTITPEKARELAKKHAVLTLLNVTEISPDVAKSLVTPYEDTFLTLPSVNKLDEETAKILGTRRGYLRLWGLKSLTPEVAAALVAHNGQRLGLSGVEEISPEVARELVNGKRNGGIVLGLAALPADLAEILADFPYYLDFPKLETLSLESARAIKEHGVAVKVGAETRGPPLHLGKAKISPEVAEELLWHEGPLGLMGVKRLEPGVGDILARHKFEVRLLLEELDSVALARKLFSESNAASSVNNLRSISPEIAVEYARRGPGPFLRLDALSLEAAAELAKYRRGLWFFALSDVSPELARVLTDREPMVYLGGIKSLDGPDAVPLAEALASTSAPVELPKLERISAPALAALRKKATITIPSNDKLIIVE